MPETLASVLMRGPLPLNAALRYGTEIASAVRELHQQGRAYGRLSASQVLTTPGGVQLAPLLSYSKQSDIGRDVHAFGGVLYQMLTGSAPPLSIKQAPLRGGEARGGPAATRAAALKLSAKCMAEKVTMQQALTELRLHSVLMRQYETAPSAERLEAEAAETPPTPFLVPLPSPQTGTAYPAIGVMPRTNSAAEPPTADNGLALPLDLESFGRPNPKPPAKLQPAGGRCPKCASPSVYESHPYTWFETMLERLHVPICRCHRCYHRYFVFVGLKWTKELPLEMVEIPKSPHS
jgi:hypothetical protein